LHVCNKCGVGLVEGDNWYPTSVRRGRHECKGCVKSANAKYVKSHPYKVEERIRRWREANPDRVKEHRRTYAKRQYWGDPEGARERARQRRIDAPELIRAINKKSRDAHPETRRKYCEVCRGARINAYIAYRKSRDIFHLFEFLEGAAV
jgi:hypothetical protein